MKNNSEIQNEKLTQTYVIYVWNNPINLMPTDINTKLGKFNIYLVVQFSYSLDRARFLRLSSWKN